MSTTPDLKYYNNPSRSPSVTTEQLKTIKEKAFYVLENIGVKVPNKRALEVYREHGALVKGQQVYLPRDIVEKYMAMAPSEFVLGGREERFDLNFNRKNSYLIPTSAGVRWRRPEDGKIQPTCKQNLMDICRFFDANPFMSMVRPTATSLDFGELAAIHDCHAMLTSSLKNARAGTALRPDLAPFIIEMARVVAGNSENFEKRCPINANICTISPLCHDDHGLECAMMYAENHIPVSFLSMPTMGSTAPFTVLGATVMGCAETVSGAVLLQMVKPGAKVMLAIETCMMEPRSGRCIIDHPFPINNLNVDAIHDWNVPCFLDSRVSVSAQDVGWESGMVDGVMSMVCARSGAEMIGAFGMLQDVMVVCPEKFVLELEAHEMAYSVSETISFEEEDLAVELMEKVGSGGNFLMEMHTVKEMRRMRLSKVLRQKGKNGQEKDHRQMAIEIYNQIIKEHCPEPLPDEVLKEMDTILKKAEEKIM